MWALILINRHCEFNTDGFNERAIDKILKISPPAFLTFLLKVTDPEDFDFTMHSKFIWEAIESIAKKNNATLIQ